MKTFRSLRAVFCVLLFTLCLGATTDGKLPDAGVIPDEATAVAVAQAIFLPIIGQEHTKKFAPYHAELKDEVWTVYGTLQDKRWTRGGGTPNLRMNKRDGKVLEIWYSR